MNDFSYLALFFKKNNDFVTCAIVNKKHHSSGRLLSNHLRTVKTLVINFQEVSVKLSTSRVIQLRFWFFDSLTKFYNLIAVIRVSCNFV